MALPKQESFTAADQNLETYNAGWVENGNGGFRIVTNQCGSKAGVNGNMQHWEGDGAFSNTHYSKATVVVTGSYTGVAARVAASTDNGYYLFADASDSYLGTNTNASYADIGSARGSFPVNSSIELRASATGKLQVFKDGAQVGVDISDTTFTGGYAGLSAWEASGAGRVDNWEGGNLGGGPTAAWLQRNYWWDNY